MKSKHIYYGKIPNDELYNFINPIEMTIDIDRKSFPFLFNYSYEVDEYCTNTFDSIVRQALPSMNEDDRRLLCEEYSSFTYVPNSKGYDFKLSPISFINNIFYLLNIDKNIDFINLDNESGRNYFVDLVKTNIDDCIKNKDLNDYQKKILLELGSSASKLVSMDNNTYNDYFEKRINNPKNMLFYLAYKSLIRYEHTRDEKYLVFPYEYYHNVYSNYSSVNEHNSEWPLKIRFNHRGKLWFDEFADEYESIIGKDRVINDSIYRLGFNELIVGCEILRPDYFGPYTRGVIGGGPNGGIIGGPDIIDYDKYERLLERKLNCYGQSGFDTFIKGSLGLDGYVGFKYKNECIILDQLYKTDKFGIKNLLIEPEAFYGIPSDKLLLITSPKSKIIEAKKTDDRIERHYHTNSNWFETCVEKMSKGPNVSTSTFTEEVEKLKTKMLVKIK
jgi:hypothetical protein